MNLDPRFWLFSLRSIIAKWIILATAGSSVAGTVVEQSLHSAHLPEPLEYQLFIPEGFERATSKQALLMLHGYGGSSKDWLGAGQAGVSLESLIKEQVIEPTLLVLPSARNSWYVESEEFGAMDRAILDELVPLIEKTYAIKKWAIAGLSMGGYGALHLGLTEPVKFQFIGALSPAIFTPGTDFSEGQLKLFGKAYGDPFSANRYEATNPFNKIDEPDLPPIYLSVGDKDYFKLDVGGTAFFEQASAHDLDIEFRLLDANHTWPVWKSEFPAMLRHMANRFEN